MLYSIHAENTKQEKKMQNINLIFDFDGTIADSLNAAIKIYNEHHQALGTPPIDKEIKQQLRAMSSRKILRMLGPKIALLPKVMHLVKQKMKNEIDAIPPAPGITNTLMQLNIQPNVTMDIVTSNKKKNVALFLEKHNINFFRTITEVKRLRGKKTALLKIIKQHKLTPDQVYYIGDETRDIEAAKTCKTHSVAVTWGYNHTDVLQRYQPDFLFNDANELLTLIQDA